MTPRASGRYRCGVNQGYATIPFFAKWSFTWPFMHLELGPDAFVLRPVRFLRFLRKPLRLQYEAVTDAAVRSKFPPYIRLHLADPSEGVLKITTPNEGALALADRLDAFGVRVIRTVR
jgi:hypothetical protein